MYGDMGIMKVMVQGFASDRMVTPGGVRPGVLLVEGGLIRGMCRRGEIPDGVAVTEFGADALLPGMVDTHVHINEPGRTEWEGYWTGTRAAAAGGYTTLVDMPLNCLPETTTVEALDEKRRAAEGKCFVDWAAWGGVIGGGADGSGPSNAEDIVPLARAGVPGFKCFLVYPGCEGFSMIDRERLREVLPRVAETGLPLLVHAELAGPIEHAAEGLRGADWRRYGTYLQSRPDAAEVGAVAMLVELCRVYPFRLHIVHLATAEALPMLRAAKAEGLPVTVETCPHYLHFAAEKIQDGATLLKCAPPIRSAANREGLWEGLREGVIDLVATDHSPCRPEMKRLEEGRFDRAWGGIASLSVALPVVWTDAVRRGFGMEDVVRWMSAGPAALAGMSGRTGALDAGREASFVRFDAEGEFVVRAEGLQYRHRISPYLGERLRGVVRGTWVRGEMVWDGAEICGEPRGREVFGMIGGPA